MKFDKTLNVIKTPNNFYIKLFPKTLFLQKIRNTKNLEMLQKFQRINKLK